MLNISAAPDAKVADDLLVAFDLGTGELPDQVRGEIGGWVQGWLATYHGAIVVMAGNGISQNSQRSVREGRLRSISRTLEDSGVSEDRIRYTDQVINLDVPENPIPRNRGVVCIRVFRSVILDAGVMPISDLFPPAD
jgi:hypothetical protein